MFVNDGLDDEEEEDGDEGRTSFTDKFFLKTKDARSILSSSMYDCEICERSKEIYGY